MDLKRLKEMYSGQTPPDWELERYGLKEPAKAPEEAPKRRGRPPKTETPETEGE